MAVLLFINEDSRELEQKVQESITSVISHNHLEIISNLNQLSGRLCKIPNDIDMMVLFAADHEQLSSLISIGDFMEDIRIILVLPDREAHTVSNGHKLSPRFLTFKDNDFSDLKAVLKKMTETRKYSWEVSA